MLLFCFFVVTQLIWLNSYNFFNVVLLLICALAGLQSGSLKRKNKVRSQSPAAKSKCTVVAVLIVSHRKNNSSNIVQFSARFKNKC